MISSIFILPLFLALLQNTKLTLSLKHHLAFSPIIKNLELRTLFSSIGCKIIRTFQFHMTDSNSNLIRLQNSPDKCIQNIFSLQDIMIKIKSAREVQSQYRNADLYERQWISRSSDDEWNIAENINCSTFKVMQFNVLAEGLSVGPIPPEFDRGASNKGNKLKSTYGGFTEIPNPEISLNFSLRRWRLMEILLAGHYDFDILALQELDRYHAFFHPLMIIGGYKGIFVPKPYSPCVQCGWYSDGCAFFWKEGIFKVVEDISGTYDVGSQVFLITLMEHIESARLIIFATTHLKAGKGRVMEEMRTAQCEQLLNAIQCFARGISNKSGVLIDKIPIILLGDFNSDIREEKSCINTILRQTNPLMKSTYKIDPPQDHLYTTWKTRGSMTSKRIIDYIFYSGSRGIQCTNVLDTPRDDDLEETLFPGFRYPSDHLALGATFQILNA